MHWCVSDVEFELHFKQSALEYIFTYFVNINTDSFHLLVMLMLTWLTLKAIAKHFTMVFQRFISSPSIIDINPLCSSVQRAPFFENALNAISRKRLTWILCFLKWSSDNTLQHIYIHMYMYSVYLRLWFCLSRALSTVCNALFIYNNDLKIKIPPLFERFNICNFCDDSKNDVLQSSVLFTVIMSLSLLSISFVM